MAYLGRGIENLSDRVVLDSLTASSTASYTLQLNSVNFVPSSAESLTVSLNGVIQAPISSYTVSGSTLTFASSLSASDSIDFIIAERGITLQTPSAGSVGTSQLASGAVTNDKISATAGIATTKLGAGAVLQVVQASDDTVTSLTSTSYTDTGLSASITPSSTSSKILIQTYAQFGVPDSSLSGDDTFIRLLRDSTAIGGHGNVATDAFSMINESGGAYESRYINTLYLDSPSSTSSITYKIQFKNRNASKQAYYNRRGGDTLESGQSYMILTEIAG